ncbi:MAG TPA: DUF3046 domain-containing protein [Actinotalea caeni]|uniref:DUF3046 domain-containing protein n=1 Tax=Actinotalea caeni TaxID=1348467 RepID=UPI0012E1B3AB|nr:DUF3046 domain-containing protein [Actinotalea caeni]HLV54153.1 DUF3046 domain-containing protein [Actinotalea caeni]
MKHSELRAAMEAAFGARATSVAADLVLGALDHRTAEQALADGEPPGAVWAAICEAQDLPDDLRWHHRRDHRRRR